MAIVRDRSRTPLYPLPPLIFCAMCVYMLYSSLRMPRDLPILGLLPLAVGLPLYAISQWRTAASGRSDHRRQDGICAMQPTSGAASGRIICANRTRKAAHGK